MWNVSSGLLLDWIYSFTFGLENHDDFVAMNLLFRNFFVPYFNIDIFVNLDLMCKGVLLSCLPPQ